LTFKRIRFSTLKKPGYAPGPAHSSMSLKSEDT